MRICELLLIIANSVFIVGVGYNTNRAFKYILIITNAVLFSAHVVLEGMRYQMLFSYIVVAGILLYTAVKGKSIPKGLRVAVKITTVILLLMTGILAVYFPVFQLPKPTGAYTVGVKTFHWTEQGTDRELMVKVFYPGENVKGAVKEGYFPDFNQFAPLFSRYMGYPSFAFNQISRVKTHALQGVPVSEKEPAYPLVVFSHGLGLSKELYTSYLEELTSHGYIVAAVDHTGFTMGTVFPDKHVERYTLGPVKSLAEMSGYSDLWSQDLRFVIDKFVELNQGKGENTFANKVDMERVGAFGHSFGGAAAYNLCFTDKRVKCGIDLDGTTFYLPPANIKLQTPFLMITNPVSAAYVKGGNKTADKSLDADALFGLKLNEGLKASIQCSGTLISIKGARHNSFTDYGLILPLEGRLGVHGTISAHRACKIINYCMLSFFDQYLKDKASPMLEKRQSPYKEMVFEKV